MNGGAIFIGWVFTGLALWALSARIEGLEGQVKILEARTNPQTTVIEFSDEEDITERGSGGFGSTGR